MLAKFLDIAFASSDEVKQNRQDHLKHNGGPVPHHLLRFQTFSYSSSQLLVGFSQVFDHPLLYRFINVHKI